MFKGDRVRARQELVLSSGMLDVVLLGEVGTVIEVWQGHEFPYEVQFGRELVFCREEELDKV